MVLLFIIAAIAIVIALLELQNQLTLDLAHIDMVFVEIDFERSRVNQPFWKAERQIEAAPVGKIKVGIKMLPQHPDGIMFEIPPVI